MKPISTLELRKQLLILVTLIIIPVLGILLYTGFRQYQDTMMDIENDARRLIKLFIDEQVAITNQTKQFLKVLSHVPSVRKLDIKECNRILQAIHKDNPQYSTIVVANDDGLIDCCAIPLKNTINVTDRSWFKRINESHEFVVDNFVISRSAKKASLPFAYPLLSSDGERLVGAVGAAFNLAYYKTIFDTIIFPRDSVIILTDRSGRLLYHSFEKETCLGKKMKECWGFELPKERQGKFEVKDLDGKNRIYWFERLWVGQETNEICLLIGIPRQVLFSDAKQNVLINVFMLSIVALVSLVISWFFGGRFILDPVNRLVIKTRRVQEGDFSTPETIGELPGELEKLSQAFDDMVLKLAKREEELQAIQANLVTAQKIARLGSWEWDVTQNKSLCSEEFYRLFGIAPQTIDVSFKKILEMVHPDDQNRIEKAVKKALTGEHPYDEVFRIIRPDGTQRIHHAKAEVVFDKNGRPLKMFGTHMDITEKRKLEAQLQKAQKMESIGNLAGGIAHDFNNLLFPIIGMSEMLLEDLPENSPEYENVREILKAGLRGSDLVKQILAFSRQSELKRTPIRIQHVLKDVIKLCRSTLPADVEIIQDIQKDCGLVMADATQIHQVAMNLITNAYHAIESSGGNIKIHLSETVPAKDNTMNGQPALAGKYALLKISDTGCGIDQKIQDKIFEPYFTTKEKGKGTGLGLALVYGIVKEYGGEIFLETQVGKGTSFNVYFPLIKRESDSTRPELTPVIAAGHEHILLVDDEEAIVNLERLILERLGYTVTSFTNSLDAISAFRSDPDIFDVVITDMTMPKMTGDRLAEEILSKKPNIPIVICTGFSERINKEQAERIGVKGFLMKPVVISDLAQMIRNVLDESKNI